MSSTAVNSPPLDPKVCLHIHLTEPQPYSSQTYESASASLHLLQGLLDELTDAEKLGSRGEWWFAAQCLAIFLIVVPPSPLQVRHRLKQC